MIAGLTIACKPWVPGKLESASSRSLGQVADALHFEHNKEEIETEVKWMWRRWSSRCVTVSRMLSFCRGNWIAGFIWTAAISDLPPVRLRLERVLLMLECTGRPA